MTVTVLSIYSLKNHANDAKEAASCFRQEISSAERIIEAKVSGQQAEAIEAFISKLNSLSYVLNEQYPQIIETYVEALLSYVARLDGVGFYSLVKSKGEDIQTIKEWLDTTKAKEFSDIGQELTRAISNASAALAMSPMPTDFEKNVSSYIEDITDCLKKFGEERVKTHTDLENAKNNFKTKLESIAGQLDNLKVSLANARCIIGFEVSTALELIRRGYLTQNNISCLDSIQEMGDGAALKVILSEPGYSSPQAFFRALGSVDGSEVSKPMMDIVYNRVYTEFSKVDSDESPFMDNIRTYVYAIANQNQEKSKSYFENLVYAGDRYASVIGLSSKSLVPKLPHATASESEFQKYDDEMRSILPQLEINEQQMKKAGQLSSLFEALNVMRVGENHRIHKSQGSKVSLDRSVVLSNLKWKENGFSFKVEDKSTIWTNSTESNTTIYDTEKGTNLAKYGNELNQLNKNRETAIKDFLGDIAKSTASKYIPGASQIIDLVSSTLEVDDTLSSRLKLADKYGKATFKGLYKESLQKGISRTANLFSLYESLSGFEDREIKIKENQKITLFDVGGRSLKNENGYTKSDIRYDLQAILKVDDMEKNGLMGYAYRHAGSSDIEVKKEFIDKFSKNLKEQKSFFPGDSYQLFSGNSKKSLDEVGMDTIAQGLTNFEDKSDFKMKEVVPIKDKDGHYREKIELNEFEVEDYANWGTQLHSLILP